MAYYIKGNSVANAKKYELFKKANGVYTSLAEASEINFEVSALGLASGSHVLVVKAKADGYEDSEYSNEVIYNVTGSGGNTGENTGGNTGDNSGSENTDVVFTNDEFEVGALDGSGNEVDLATRYRTKAIKKFNQGVLLSGKVLAGEANPAHVRVAQYDDTGKFVSMGQFADSATIPANTGFRLILERSGGGNVLRGNVELTVPAGATRLYVNTLKTDKATSNVTTPRETINGNSFKDGLYYYGTVGETKGTVTSSSKMAAYEGYISVNAGEKVIVNVYTSATIGCVFTDDADKVILLGENSTFSGRDYQPLDFFTYEAQ